MAVLYFIFDDPAKNDQSLPARAARGHMPFKGHRTVAGFLAQQSGTRKPRKDMEWGFDPESLKAHK